MGKNRSLVIGPNIEEQMAPFRNHRETGYKFDHHVVGVDILPEASEYYRNNIRSHIRSPAGEPLSAFDERFWRDETEEERLAGNQQSELQNRLTGGCVISVFQKVAPGEKPAQIRRVLELPPGYTPVWINLRDMQSFSECLRDMYGIEQVHQGAAPDMAGTHKRGWFRSDVAGTVYEAMRCEVPNWFWYGWWVGFGDDEEAWKLKPGASGSLEYDSDTAPGYAHSAQKGAIDFAAMRSRIANPTGRIWDAAAKGECYDDIYDDFPPDTGWVVDESRLMLPREQFIQIAVDKLIDFDYIIMDGARRFWPGDTAEERQRNFNAFVDALPEETLLTRVGSRA